MPDLKLFLLGSPQLERDHSPVELERRKGTALLAYLAVTGTGHSRDTLAALLWPEADQSRARSALRRDLSVLNKALGTGWLDIGRETISLNNQAGLWVDVNEFRQALAACQAHDHAPDAVCPNCVPHLRRAVSLYQADFLAGFTLRDSPEFDEWQRFQTEDLRRELAGALEQLVRSQSSEEDFKAAIPYARRWLALDPLHEPAHRRLMELYARAGQRAAALHQFAECERILHDELGVPPSLETTALAERIRLETGGQQGQLIKSYELRELIGAGGFGEVYRAYQPQVRREVAVKVILPHYANQPDFIRRFEAEAHMVAQVEHPHIVPLYDYWREPDGAYLVMRWLRGGSLETALQGGPWSPDATAQLLEQVAAGLMLAHQRGIIHRDLKPANILLDEAGNAYLSDFGIAKEVAAPVTRSQAGLVMGSPAYMAPETVNNDALSPQTDIYSLGVILFEMLTGQHPFPETTPPMMIIKHLSEPIPPLQLADPDLSPALDEVIQRATAKKPGERYADTIALAGDFRRALGSEEVPLTTIPADSTPLLVPNPYKGLHAFQEADAADFFGRETLIEQLLIRLILNIPSRHQSPIANPQSFGLAQSLTTSYPLIATTYQQPITNLQNFLAIVGPSGSGKSSLVKAGLIPALRRNAIPGSKDWFIVEMTPGNHPLEELETALLRMAINPPPTLLEQLRADERGLLRAVKRILPNDGTELLLVIDQFEELFTLVDNEAVRSHFLNSLRVAVTQPQSRLRVVITLRADFYDRPLLYPGFGDLLRQRMETVLPLSTEELAQAIAGPAERVGASLEPGLVSVITADVQEQPGTLPLMQYALTELFEHREGRRLTLEAYQTSGGVLGALARRADELYANLDNTGRDAARRLFLRLVTLGEGGSEGTASPDTRRRVLRSELAALTPTKSPWESKQGPPSLVAPGEESPMEAIIDLFGQYRLLTFDRDPVSRGPTVEVAHEALIREWHRLRRWLDKDREFLLWQQRLRAGLHQWTASEQDEGALLRGAPLAEAEVWLNRRRSDLNEAEREFIQAGLALREREAAERETQLRRELEVAQELANSEKRRAEEQAQAATSLRKRAVWLAGMGLVAVMLAVAAGVLGVQSTQNAAQALEAQQAAEREARRARAGQLVLQAQAVLESNEDPSGSLPLLLAREAVLTTLSPDGHFTFAADAALRQAIEAVPPWRKSLPHPNVVNSATFSPDGQRVLTAGGDGWVRIWDVSSGEEIITSYRHKSGALNSATFSPDGKIIAVVGDDGLAELRTDTLGSTIHALKGHTGSVFWAAFSPDGKSLVTTSQPPDNAVRLWDVVTGREIHRFQGYSRRVSQAVFSPDGQTIVTAADHDQAARLWDLATGQEIQRFVGHTHHVIDGVAFSPDGQMIVTASFDKTARLWDVTTGEEIRQFIGHTDVVRKVAFSPDGNTIVTASNDLTVRLWDVATAAEIGRLAGHTGIVNTVAFSPDGQMIVTASFDQSARLWDAIPDKRHRHLAQQGQVKSVAIDPPGNPWSGHQHLHQVGQVKSVAIDPPGTTIVTASNLRSGDARILNLNTGRELHRLEGHIGEVTAVGMSPDGQTIITTGSDKTARLWDTATGDQIMTLIGHTDFIFDAAFSPDGETIVTASADKTARLWHTASGEEIARLEGHTDQVRSAGFSPDGTTVVTAGGFRDPVARLWEITSGEEIRSLEGHTDILNSAHFSPDGQTIITASGDGTARLWEVATGQELRRFEGHDRGVNSARFSPSGQTIVTAGFDQTVRVWDVTTGKEIRRLEGHSGPVNAALFSPDGETIITASDDKTVRVWPGMEELLALAESLIQRDPPEFTPAERIRFGLVGE